MMVTDDDRRSVAERLRGLDYSDLQESLICAYLDALGIKGYEDWVGIAHRLADLIEPDEPKVKCVAEVKVDGEQLEKLFHEAVVEYAGVDREALLALVEELSGNILVVPALYGTYQSGYVAACHDVAHRIREALGVSDD